MVRAALMIPKRVPVVASKREARLATLEGLQQMVQLLLNRQTESEEPFCSESRLRRWHRPW